jgi:uncharacterized protein YyaL (SSP411 family)
MTNALGDETSPYLRQHADNPVDWLPWNAGALALARSGNRPILLSVGYSACHWCHVMAHECFEDDAIAAVMNRDFVNIKVDREERPDLDRIYQLAHNALTGRGGGWPLTVFLTPDDLLPFFAGTYFPPAPRHGLPGFPQVLEGVARHYRERRDDIEAQNMRLQSFLDGMSATTVTGEPTAQPVEVALRTLADRFDPVNGGHRGGPKFPHATEIALWLGAVDSGDDAGSAVRHPDAAAIVRTTLDAMADRGLHDHLGGGFFRYCVDDDWTIPHFEKMLYDNAQLLPVYAEAALRLERPAWLEKVAGTLEFLERDLRNPGGGFYCALDADSPGGEGAYYVWTPPQVAAVLPDMQAAEFMAEYGLDGLPNFEDHAWHLLRRRTAIDDPEGRDRGVGAALGERLADSRARLLAVRRQRPAPALDDKILTGWNALSISGLARSARALRRMHARHAGFPAGRTAASGPFGPLALADRAQRLADGALDHLHKQAWRDDRLFADMNGRFPGYLDDYAFLLDAIVEQLRQRWSARDADWARSLADGLIDRFEDTLAGGFWFTAHDHERLPQRPKPWNDEATPSGNAIAVRGLTVLGHLFGESRWLDAAERALRAAAGTLDSHPHASASLLAALQMWLEPARQIVVRAGDTAAFETWQAVAARADTARDDWFFVPDVPRLPGVLSSMRSAPGGLAYVCERGTCSPALGSIEDLAAHIGLRDR